MCTGENDIVAVKCGLLCCCMVVLTVCVCVCVCGIPTSSSVEWGFCVVCGWLVCCLMCSWIIGGSLIKRHCCCKMWFAVAAVWWCSLCVCGIPTSSSVEVGILCGGWMAGLLFLDHWWIVDKTTLLL